MNPGTKKRFLWLFSIIFLLFLTPSVILAEDQTGADEVEVYLPLVLKPGGTPGSTTGSLGNGGVFIGLDGVGIGALDNTLLAPIDVTIANTGVPTVTVPSQAQVLGSFYQISAGEDVSVSPDEPLILSFPVPTGAYTTNLALGYLQSGEFVLDADPDIQAWIFQEGFYDPDQESFLTTLSALREEGQTFLLVEHPDFESPSNVPPANLIRPTSPSDYQFNVRCVNFTPTTDCTSTIENTVEGFLGDISGRIQQDLGFHDPRLHNLVGTMDFNPNSLSSLGYTAYIEPHDEGFCQSLPAAGYYSHGQARLVLCLNPAIGLDPDYVNTLIHEYFHATQYGYTEVFTDFMDRTGRKDEPWIIEGMAKAAEESYFGNDMVRSTIGGWIELHKVDRTMKSENGFDEYFAQDYWVVYGQMLGGSMAYFHDILLEGATTDDVASVLGDGERIETYWDWAKNQAMEKGIDFGGALGTSCELESQVVDLVDIFPLSWNTNFYHDVTVDPLTSIVVQVIFDYNYDVAAGTVFPVDPSQNPEALQALRYKFYKDGEDGCEAIPDGPRTYLDVTPGDTYYVLISNIDKDDPYPYRIIFELSPLPPVSP